MPESSSQFRSQDANLILIVVGAHLRAEVADRPLAYRLRERIEAWLEKHGQHLNPPVIPLVCTDIWYLNQQELQRRPTISLGGPGVNAVSAFFADKLAAPDLPGGQVVVQVDPEMVDLRVSLWGRDHDLTVDALDRFVREHLDSYLRAAATQVEPQEG